MPLNRKFLRQSVVAGLTGLGAFRWLSPKVRWWFIGALVVYGFAIGSVVDRLPETADTVQVILLTMIAAALPLTLYDLILSYLLLERREREGDLAVAARIQRDLFPQSLPESPRWEWAGFNRPARSIGGDYWDVIPVGEGRTLFLVADISGKGIPAALLMSGLRAQLRLLATEDCDVADVASQLNRGFFAETAAMEYATMFLGMLDDRSGEITYVNAGHPEALLLRAGGDVESLSDGGVPVGMMSGTVYDSGTVRWSPGDRLIVFSDGALDVAVGARGPLEPEELIPVAREAPGPAAAVGNRITEFIRSHERGEPEDDITVLVCLFR
ncbi:MAG: serine/threonine-protein phosphatase [Gemmatimonadetes bacterium]|nr:serine/threonine-protein phosphatase [Gemmatimonadota bacterium]